MKLVVRLGRTGLAVAIAAATYFLCYRPLQINWGATSEEIARPLAGDGLIAAPLFLSTRAISIAAPPERVWPWVAQVAGPGVGWYSYDLIDNRSRVSAARIIPASAHTVGLQLAAGKEKAKSFYVRELEAPRSMLVEMGAGGLTCAWELVPGDEGQTRLLSRVRMRSDAISPLAVAALDGADFVMMRQMMKGIRDRVEGRPIRSFRSLTTEFLLWVACFLGFLVAEVRVVLSRRWLRPALVAVASSITTIGVVMWQPPVWVDAVGAALIVITLTADMMSRSPAAPAARAAFPA